MQSLPTEPEELLRQFHLVLQDEVETLANPETLPLLALLANIAQLEVDDPAIDGLEKRFLEVLSEDAPTYGQLLTLLGHAIRKIIFLFPENKAFWYPAATHRGVLNTPLLLLLQGQLETLENEKERPRLPVYPLPAGRVRDRLLGVFGNWASQPEENTNARSAYFILSCLLEVLRTHSSELEKRFFPERAYLEQIVRTKEYATLDRLYIELFGQEDGLFQDIETIGVEVIDEYEIFSEIEGEEYEEDHEDEESEDNSQRIDSVLSIARDTPQFIIIGSPGAGKTTTLYKILYHQAREILAGDRSQRIPVVLAANKYTDFQDFRFLLRQRTEGDWAETALEQGRLLLMFDGLNEIPEEYRDMAQREIQEFIEEYPENGYILSERKYGFRRGLYNLPVFEIQELQEGQIKSFITNYVPENAEEIWQQIAETPELLELAFNPLLLKMILSVSQDGKLPENRGELMRNFVRAILEREAKRKPQMPQQLKYEVLSHLAYRMQIGGHVSVTIPQAHKVMDEKLRELNSYHTPKELHAELIDNFLLKEGGTNDVLFIHQTYQDFFCATALRKTFLAKGKLSLDITLEQWYEPLLIASDIMDDAKNFEAYLEYLFSGGEKHAYAKALEDFVPSDFNQRPDIACRMAYKAREKFPESYALAETYLKNYTVLWYSYYQRFQHEAIPLENLLAAVGALSSPALLKKVIRDDHWVQLWLYSEREEETGEKEEEEEQRFMQRVTALVEHTSNFEALYEVSTKREFLFFKSLIDRLRKIKYTLISSTSTFFLARFFETHPDLHLLFRIGQDNLDFLLTHFDRKNASSADMKRFLKHLSKNRQLSPRGITILFEELHEQPYSLKFAKGILDGVLFRFPNYSEETRIAFIENLLGNGLPERLRNKIIPSAFRFPHMHPYVFRVLEEKYAKDGELDRVFLQNLQGIPYAQLTSTLQNLFQGHLQEGKRITLVPDSVLKVRRSENKIYFRFPLSMREKLQELLKNKSEIQTGNYYGHFYEVEFQYASHEVFTLKLLKYETLPEDFPAPQEGGEDLQLEHENFSLVEWEHSKSGQFLHALPTQTQGMRNEHIGQRGTLGQYGEVEVVGLNSIPKKPLEPLYILAKFYVMNCSLEDYDEENAALHVTHTFLNLNFAEPLRYHPDIIARNPEVLDLLKRNILKKKVKKFVRDLGLSHLFHTHIQQTDYGVIVDVFMNRVKVYSITHKNFIDFFVLQEKLNEYKTNEIVVIEDNLTIGSLPDQENRSSKIGFLESEVIAVDLERRDGFIRRSIAEKAATNIFSDYFFHFDNCNFEPHIGDYVSFIPALNRSKNYKNQPIALKVQRIERPHYVCEITKIGHDPRYDTIYGFGRDVHTGEQLYFKFLRRFLRYIKGVETKIEAGELFEYIIYSEAFNGKYKRIKLISRRDEERPLHLSEQEA